MENSFTINSLTETQRGIIRIVKSAIKGTKETLPSGFDWIEAQKIVRNHSIEGLTYFGLKNMDIQIPTWLRESFYQECAFLTRLWNEAEKVMTAFTESGIDYIPLKGIKTKELYPNKFMRHMSDVDILIHLSDYDVIKNIMIALGWKEGIESDHELHWAKGNLNIELHKRIIPSYNADYYREIGDGWEWLKEHSDREYDFIHFAKHYRDGGIGIGHLCDLIYCDSFSGFGLEEFYQNVKRTLTVWLEDAEEDDKTKLISDTILNSGKYGTSENKSRSMDLRRINDSDGDVKKATRERRRNILFLSWDEWKIRNPILRQWPILLPFLWLWRAASFPFKRKGLQNFKAFRTGVVCYQEYKDALSFVGLEFRR